MKNALWTKEQALNHLNGKIAEVEVVDSLGPCWEWQGSRTRDGYGQFGASGPIALTRQKLTHRAMYALTHDFEFTSRNQQVMHQCHNRACCNPDHLKLGTAKENIAQAIERGTWKACTRHGEENPWSKLTEDDVRAARSFHHEYGCTYRLLGEMFGLSSSSIREAVIGKTWGHVK